MYIVAVIGQRWRAGWKRAAGAALTIIVLSAVAVVGLTLFGSEVLAAWQAPGEAEQALASGGAFEGLLSFDAPAVLSSRFKAQTAEAEQSIRRAENAPLLAKNWRYTFNPQPEPPGASSLIVDALVLSLNLYVSALKAEIALADFNNFIEGTQNGLAANPSPFASPISNALRSFQGLVNSAVATYVNALAGFQSLINTFIPTSFQPPPIPPASPCTC